MKRIQRSEKVIQIALKLADNLKLNDDCFLADIAEAHGNEVCALLVKILKSRGLDIYDGSIRMIKN